MSTHELTIEQLETLAASFAAETAENRAKLLRLITAEARILAQRSPEKFRKAPTEYSDEDGSWDSSYPPKQKYKNHTGPRLVRIFDNSVQDIATTTGFYYDWKRVTTDPGMFLDRDGQLWGRTETGTGRLGQFAAHPGDCDVQVECEYDTLDTDDIDLQDLVLCEKKLREHLAESLADMGGKAA